MRSLNPHPRSRDESRRDDGAVLVWVGLMLTVLLGMGALVIDAGALYSERRQLQNGADAGALAVARDLAAGNAIDEYSMADTYADANANDGATNIDQVCGSGPGLDPCSNPPAGADGVTGYVQVSTSTADAGGGEQVEFLFAPILDAANVGRTVDANAVAAWGPTGATATFPFTFSVCEFEHFGGSIAGGTVPSGTNFIYSHKSPPEVAGWDCGINPNSGSDFPGGFGFLDNEYCVAEVRNGWVGGDTGNVMKGCTAADLQELRGQTVAIPLYDQTQGTGSNAEFHIIGFAGFTFHGYKLPPDEWANDGPPWQEQGSNWICPDTTGDSGTCIYGEFTEVAVDGEIGSGNNYGSSSISMIG